MPFPLPIHFRHTYISFICNWKTFWQTFWYKSLKTLNSCLKNALGCNNLGFFSLKCNYRSCNMWCEKEFVEKFTQIQNVCKSQSKSFTHHWFFLVQKSRSSQNYRNMLVKYQNFAPEIWRKKPRMIICQFF